MSVQYLLVPHWDLGSNTSFLPSLFHFLENITDHSEIVFGRVEKKIELFTLLDTGNGGSDRHEKCWYQSLAELFPPISAVPSVNLVPRCW